MSNSPHAAVGTGNSPTKSALDRLACVIGNVRQQTTDGHYALPIPVPGNTSLTGLFFAAQMAAFDPGSTAALPIVTSNALRITVQ